MGQLVARLLGKPQLEVKDGKVSLSEEEKKTIRDTYGEPFLAKLESVDIEDDSESALDLFNAAVEAKTAEVTAALAARVKDLQADVLTLTNEPEPKRLTQKGWSLFLYRVS